jgi:hypothetical protein
LAASATVAELPSVAGALRATHVDTVSLPGSVAYSRTVGEFWTARQRQMNSLHYVLSYRGSFKPELPAFFIERYTDPGDVVFDPFAGRGTTVLQAVLGGRLGWGNDVNPMFERVVRPKVCPATIAEVGRFLAQIDWDDSGSDPADEDLGMFYDERTLRELMALRRHLRGDRSQVARFVELVALSRLHGHSPGFFSVYSFPQISVSREAQRRINERRSQRPDYRDVAARILRKTRRSLRDTDPIALRKAGRRCLLTADDSRSMAGIPGDSVDLIVTSPPFLDKVDYVHDNWLEFWFLGLDVSDFRDRVVQTPDLSEWTAFIRDSLREMQRVLRPGGVCVVEVGDVVHGSDEVNLDEVIVELSAGLGLAVESVLIQSQQFTKLAHCFQVQNNKKGTNTNRCVVLRKHA